MGTCNLAPNHSDLGIPDYPMCAVDESHLVAGKGCIGNGGQPNVIFMREEGEAYVAAFVSSTPRSCPSLSASSTTSRALLEYSPSQDMYFAESYQLIPAQVFIRLPSLNFLCCTQVSLFTAAA